MRRLIRNIAGEPRPLIMHRRLSWLRTADSLVRHRACLALGIPYSGRATWSRNAPQHNGRERA